MKKKPISESMQRIYLTLIGKGLSLAEAARLTEVPETSWSRLATKDQKFGAELQSLLARPSNITSISKEFDLERELAGVIPEVFYGLREEARTGKGISRITALTELRKWHAEIDNDNEPYELEDAHPENEKVVPIKQAV